MKKIVLYWITSAYFALTASAQFVPITSSPEREAGLIPNSPNVGTLGIYGSDPIDQYTGTANISIPLYNLQLDGLDIPISASYNTGGIKVRQEASLIGLGWNFNAGAVITNEINGFEDTKSYPPAQPQGYIYSKDYLTRNHPTYNLEITSDDEAELVNNNQIGQPRDTEPDIFNAHLFDKSVKFVLDKLGTGNTTITVPAINHSNIEVTYDTSNDSFEILDDNGFKYTFSEIEYGTPINSYEPRVYTTTFDEEDLVKLIGSVRSQHDIEQDKTAWLITSVTSPYGNVINFSYERAIYFTYPVVSDQMAYSTNKVSSDNGLRAPRSLSVFGTIQRTGRIQAIETAYLSSITGDFGRIDFTLASREDLFTRDALNARKTLGYNYHFLTVSTNPPKRLISFDVKDKDNNVVREVDFSQTYFNSDEQSHIHKEKYLRLKLDGITIDDQDYAFSYIQPNDLPAKNSKDLDFWGYYNNAGNTEMIPSYQRFNVSWSLDLGYEYFAQFDHSQKCTRKSDFNSGKIGLLDKVTYPTGGATKYIYEGNSATVKKPDPYTPSFSTIGGFRHSGISNSSDYAWTYQYLKEANDPSYSFLDFDVCSGNIITVNPNNSFTIPNPSNYTACTGVDITTNITCVTSNCSFPGFVFNEDAVWLVDENNVITSVRRTTSYQSGTETYSFNLTPGKTYTLKTKDVTQYDTYNNELIRYQTTASLTYSDFTPPSDLYEEFEVGGARMAEIHDLDEDQSIIKKTKFDYDFTNADGNTSSSGLLMDELIYHSKNNGFFEYTPEHYYNNSINLHSDNVNRRKGSANGHHIGYSQVSQVLTSNQNSTTIGKTVSKFINEPNEYVSRSIGLVSYIKDGPINTSYGDVYLLNMMPKSNAYKNGNLLSVDVVDNTDQLVKSTSYTYEEKAYPPYINDEAYPHISYQLYVLPDVCPVGICGFYPLLPYYKEVRNGDQQENYLQLTKTESSVEYLVNGSFSNSTTYDYNSSAQKEREESTNSDGLVRASNYYYPKDLTSKPFMSDLIAENRVAEVVKTEFLQENELLLSQEVQYASTLSRNGTVHRERTETTKQGATYSDMIYEMYSNKGRLLQYRENEGGMQTTLLWGYNQLYPVAKIENASFSEVAQLLNVTENSLEVRPNEIHMAAINALRTSLPNAFITTYTYKPLVGMVSMTDVNGQVTTYQYDTNNRLEKVMDDDGNVISQNQYNYGN